MRDNPQVRPAVVPSAFHSPGLNEAQQFNKRVDSFALGDTVEATVAGRCKNNVQVVCARET